MKAARSITVELTEGNARYVIHALRELKDKCVQIVQDENASEDDVFFHGNDLMETKLVLEEIEKLAIAKFGEKILNFSHKLL